MLGDFLCSESRCGKGINNLKSISKQTKASTQSNVSAIFKHFPGLQFVSTVLHTDFKDFYYFCRLHVWHFELKKKKLQLLLCFGLYFKRGRLAQVPTAVLTTGVWTEAEAPAATALALLPDVWLASLGTGAAGHGVWPRSPDSRANLRGGKKKRKKGTSEPNPAENLFTHMMLFRASKP